MTTNHSIYVIVPSYNEGYKIREILQGLLEKKYTVVVVDDASTDNTRGVLSSLPVYYIRHLINLGQGAALRTGITLALDKGASYIATIDADGQHDVADIEKMLTVLEQQKADIVFGSRFLKGSATNIHLSRKLVLKSARFINYLISGILLTDANNGIRIMTSKAAFRLKITENRSTHSAQIQTLVKQNQLKYAECPVNVSYTEYSRTKGLKNVQSVRILYELLLFKLFR